MSDEVTIICGSGNVFEDIGLPNPEELSIKSQLVINLKRVVESHRLTQKEVAQIVGVDQPTISKVLRGQLSLVSTDRLLEWHKSLDQEVQLTIKDHFTRHSHGRKRDGDDLSGSALPC